MPAHCRIRQEQRTEGAAVARRDVIRLSSRMGRSVIFCQAMPMNPIEPDDATRAPDRFMM
jgi:hypothetical protein